MNLERDLSAQLMLSRNRVEIALGVLAANLRAIRQRIAPTRLLLTVKKDGYGHGLVEAAKTAAEVGVDYLGVACIGEALRLRNAGIRLPILNLGLAFDEEIECAIENDVELTVATLDGARAVAALAARLHRRPRVHLKVDTGLGRLGLFPEQLAGQLDALAGVPDLEWAGLYSHLADVAGNPRLTSEQLERFREAAGSVEGWLPFRHLGASGAIAKNHLHFDMLRVGIAAYGGDSTLVCSSNFSLPSCSSQNSLPELLPVMSLKSRITFIKDVPAGRTISYGATYVTPESTRVGVVGAGYGNGYPRLVSNRGHVLIAGRPAPILGRICMDQMMVNLNAHPDAKVGDEALLFGRSGADTLPVRQVAAWAQTISYEVLCCVGMMNERVYLG